MNTAEMTLTDLHLRILLNVCAGRDHYHGANFRKRKGHAAEGYEWMYARFDLLKWGLLAREGEQGLARIRFVLTEAGRRQVDRHFRAGRA